MKPRHNESMFTLFAIGVGALIFVLINGCGRTTVCQYELKPTHVDMFGPLEKQRCSDGEVILSSTPRYAPGGQITHIEVQCARVEMSCS